MSPRLVPLLAALLFVVLALAGGASGAGHGYPEREAQSLRDQGLRQLRSGELGQAAHSLQAAYRLLPDADGLYLLCSLARLEGRDAAAKDLARRYLAEIDGAPAAAGRTESLQEAQRILALPDVPVGELALLGPAGSWVLVDDRLVGRLPLSRPLWVAPGSHHVLVELGNSQRVVNARVEVAAGRRLELRVQSDSDAVLVTRVPSLLVLFTGSALPARAAERLQQAIAAAAEREHLYATPTAPAGGCPDSIECLDALARRGEAAYLLDARASGTGQDDGAWELKLRLLSGATGELALSRALTCPACTTEAAAELLQRELADALALGAARPHGDLWVVSEPPGAALYVDGRLLGTTPYRRAAWTGSRHLELRIERHTPWSGDIEVAESMPRALSVRLQPLPPPPAVASPPPAPVVPNEGLRMPRPRWRLVAGGLSIAAGLVLVGFGASALAVDGLCSPDTPTAAGECRRTYASAAAGGALVGTGASLAVVGSVLLILPGNKLR